MKDIERINYLLGAYERIDYVYQREQDEELKESMKNTLDNIVKEINTLTLNILLDDE